MFIHAFVLAAGLLLTVNSLQIAPGPLEERQILAQRCGVKGQYVRPTIFGSSQPSLTVPAQCGALCKSTLLCRSYSVDSTSCYLYLLPLTSLLPNNPNGNVTYYDVGCTTSTDLCWVNGNVNPLTAKALTTSTYFIDNSWTGCSALCQKTAGCKSYTLGTGACKLFSTTVATNLITPFTSSQSTQAFWDVNCPLSQAALPPYPAGPVHDNSKASQVSVVPSPKSYSSLQPFAPFVTNSPALASMAQPQFGGYGDDNTFTDEYTYTTYSLPTPTVTGSAPATTGFIPGGSSSDLPPMPCLITTGSAAQVTLLSENFIPLVSKASAQLGPLAQPTTQPAASDPLSQNYEVIQFPLFYFNAPANGPAGTYDLVYAPTSEVVALQDNGNVVLRPSSTGANFVGGYATTIFQFTCNGTLTVNQGGSTWIWSTSTNGATTNMVKGTPIKLFRALPQSHPYTLQARKNRVRSLELARKIEARDLEARGKDQEGRAPRCPNKQGFPTDLVAHYKQGFQFGQGNLCDNMGDYWQLSPFDFGTACGITSLCYDLCETFDWGTCNTIFYFSALASCASKVKSWWDIVVGVACASQAVYFEVQANLDKGRQTFYQSQDAMCSCFCQDGLDQCSAPNTLSGFNCINTKAVDNNNCGTCGRACPPRTTCKGNGNCGCLGDQCGSTCLDLRNNPNNCGSCGNVCNPAYCVAGSCYKPDPASCAPDPPLAADASLSNPFSSWQHSDMSQPGCALNNQLVIENQGYVNSDGSVLNVQTFKYYNMPSSGCSATASRKQIKICPGFQYQLNFYGADDTGRTEGGVPLKTGATCSVQYGLGPPSSPTSFGVYQSSPVYQVTNQNFQGYSWTFSVTTTTPGLARTRDTPNWYLDLYVLVTCSGGPNGVISLEGVDIQQIGLA